MSSKKEQQRKAGQLHRRKMRVRSKVHGTPDRPRMAVHRTLKHMFVQVVDDTKAVTLVSACSLDPVVRETFEDGDTKTKKSFKIGLKIAELVKEKGIEEVAFDRQGFLYHGRIKAVADGARKGGLKF